MNSPSTWRVATVVKIRDEAEALKTFTFDFGESLAHDAGQHYELRLTSADGFQAARLYSAATPAAGDTSLLELTIALMPSGVVSPYLFDHVAVGSKIELRGPLGRYFVWTPQDNRPVLLVGGGTGLVPLRAIRLVHAGAKSATPMHLLLSARSLDAVAYKDEIFTGLAPNPDVTCTLTQTAPRGWQGLTRRMDGPMIADILTRFTEGPECYVCGPTPMVEAVSNLLITAGIAPESIKTERFGPTS